MTEVERSWEVGRATSGSQSRSGRRALLALILSLLPSLAFANVVHSGTAIADPIGADGQPLADGQLALIIVDGAGDGFAVSEEGTLRLGDDLTKFLGSPDDRVIGSAASFNLEGLVVGVNGGVDFDLSEDIQTGMAFAIVFFDQLPKSSTVLYQTTHYGIATHPSWILRSDGANTQFEGGTTSQFQRVHGTKADLALAEPELKLQSYASWASAHFPGESPHDLGPYADADGDGLENLVEYAFATDPLKVTRTPLLTVHRRRTGNTEEVIAEYLRPQILTEALIQLTVSNDLQHWSTPAAFGIAPPEVSIVASNRRRWRYRLASAVHQRLFYRLSITSDNSDR